LQEQTRRKDIRGRRRARRIIRDFRFEKQDVFKVNNIPSFDDSIVGYFTDLGVNH